MNPILAEDIMRQRVHRSAIMLATLLAWLLFTTNRASADFITVTVPVNVTTLHSDVTEVRVGLTLTGPKPSGGTTSINTAVNVPVVDRSVQEVVEITIPIDIFGGGAINLDSYEIILSLVSAAGKCRANNPYTAAHLADDIRFDHCRQGWNMMQTYEPPAGPMSDLIPE